MKPYAYSAGLFVLLAQLVLHQETGWCDSAAANYCRVTIAECPRDPSIVGTNDDFNSPAARSSLTCLTLALRMRDWCGSTKSVFTAYYQNEQEIAAKEAKPWGCHITTGNCAWDPALSIPFYDFENGRKVSQATCETRADYYRDICGHHAGIRADHYDDGVLLQSWRVAARSNGPELTNATARTPMIHQVPFRHERDLHGYHPRYTGDHLAFSTDNIPLFVTRRGYVSKLDADGRWRLIDLKRQMRTGLRRKDILWDGKFSISTMSDNRIVFDRTGDAYLLFNTSDAIMTEVATGIKFVAGILAHSKDQGETWTPYLLPSWKKKHRARLEFQDGNNQLNGPPPILLDGGREYVIDTTTNRLRCKNVVNPCKLPDPLYTTSRLIVPQKNGSRGTLTIGEEFTIAENAIPTGPHSGAGNVMVPWGNKIHIAYPTLNTVPSREKPSDVINVEKAFPCQKGTPQYMVTFDRITRALGSPFFLGCGGVNDRSLTNQPSPNPHNVPAIALSPDGKLNVLLGVHHDQFVYRQSLAADDIEHWSAPKLIGEPKRDPLNGWRTNPTAAAGSYTYSSFLCDTRGVLHLVTRWTGLGYRSRLVYLRKSNTSDPNANWDTFTDSYAQATFPVLTNGALPNSYRYAHQHLVVPFKNGYTVFHHKLNIDRTGRLFLNYHTWEQQLDASEAVEYCRRWPGDCPNGSLSPDMTGDPPTPRCSNGVCWYLKSSQPKDPTILMSGDGGTTWELATTDKFLFGVHR